MAHYQAFYYTPQKISKESKVIAYFLCWMLNRSLPESEKAQTQSEKDKILQEKEAELRRMQEMLAKMQAQMHQQQPL
uniref:Uncharacterized protein n=1 Tax=Rhodnius prolixus TaxID=13249 RepID=T1I443_RHOPR